MARQQRAQSAKNFAAAGLAAGDDGVAACIDESAAAVLDLPGGGIARTTREIRDLVPPLEAASAWAEAPCRTNTDRRAPVRLLVRGDLAKPARVVLEAEVERLTDRSDGAGITIVYASPQMRGARLP